MPVKRASPREGELHNAVVFVSGDEASCLSFEQRGRNISSVSCSTLLLHVQMFLESISFDGMFHCIVTACGSERNNSIDAALCCTALWSPYIPDSGAFLQHSFKLIKKPTRRRIPTNSHIKKITEHVCGVTDEKCSFLY